MLLSVFTATFNRAYCLPVLFASLVKQSCRQFEWILIDDGSTDDTRYLVEKFRKTAPWMKIVYRYKENGGKHTAHNTAIDLINGEYTMIVDSDDYLTDTAVEVALQHWEKYAGNSAVGHIAFLKGLSVSQPFCYVQHFDKIVDGLREKRIPIIQDGIASRDCIEVFRSSLFCKYKNPVFANERFLGEGSFLFPIKETADCVYINCVINICHYSPDGLTGQGRTMRLKNPRGGMYTSKLYMSPRLDLGMRVKKGLLYVCYGLLSGCGFAEILQENPYKFLTIMCLLPGWLLYKLWKHKYILA